MATIASIQAKIATIITNALTKANLLRPTLQDMLNVSTSFYSANVPPSAANDNTQNYRPGSLGRSISAKRYYVNRDASTGTAVWDLITTDFEHEDIIVTEGGTTLLAATTASVYGTCGSIDEAFIKLNGGAYLGKTIDILVLGAATTGIGILNNSDAVQFSGEPFTTYLSVRMTCTNPDTNTWKPTQLSIK